MNKGPLVSICIPTYNGEKFLETALESVQKQSYANIEVIISDDQSKDLTIAIVEKFKKSVSFPVLILEHEPSGIGANWNNCLLNSRGEFIKFLFQDDVLTSNCIQELLKPMFEYEEDLAMTVCRRSIILEEKTEASQKWIKKYGDLQSKLKPNAESNYLLDKRDLKNNSFIKSPENKIGEPTTTLFRRSILEKIGFFDEDLAQLLDIEFYYRILKYYKILIINKELAFFRLHSDQATSKNIVGIPMEYEKWKLILFKEYFWYLDFSIQKKLFKRYSWIGKLYTKFRYGE